jgi:hypothetical protein
LGGRDAGRKTVLAYYPVDKAENPERKQDISDATIAHIREDYQKKAVPEGKASFGSQWSEYGPVEVVVGTGRARCRACGQKIAKGVTALAWAEDMGGSGSFTATRIQMHAEPCVVSANPPTISELKIGLRHAKAAGDREAVAALSAELKRLRGGR